MSPQDKCTLSFYRDLEPIDDSTKVVLVRHIESGQIFVKKRLSVYSRDLYRYLLGKDISGIPHVYECLDDDDFIIVIEEYIPGQTLRRFMTEQGPLSEARAIELIEKMCFVLERLHKAERPIVCRDLKPENVILSTYDSIVIVDFDAAKFVKNETVDTVLMGTPGYAAPEQFGFAASDERTDVYAVGVFLNEMLTGCLPQEKTARGHLGHVVQRSTSLDPKERYSSVEDLRKDLRGMLYVSDGRIDRDRRFLPPGFRTHVWWKMILAIVSYSFAIFMAIMFFAGYETATGPKPDPIDSFAYGLLWTLYVIWTVTYAFDYLQVRSKMPVSRVKSPLLRIPLHILVWMFGLFVLLMLIIPIAFLKDLIR